MDTATQSNNGTGSFLQVFVVEDSAPVRERLLEMLASIEGATCAGLADTAEEATGKILLANPDAVILDIGLSQGSGFDVLRALQKDSTDIPVYVLSNHSTEPYRRLAMKLGAAAFFDKTTQIDELRALLKRDASHRIHAAH